MKKILGFINTEMKQAGIEYHFQKNKKPKPVYPYFVGELVPVEPASEDGKKEFTLVLDGFTRETPSNEGTLMELLLEAEKIQSILPPVESVPLFSPQVGS